MNSLLWIAVVLFVAWIVLRMIFAITGMFFHVLWIVALVMLGVWLLRKFTG